MTTQIFNHAEYQKKVRKMSEDALRFTITDCREAIKANPNNPKCGQYQDEINYCGLELAHREKVKTRSMLSLDDLLDTFCRNVAKLKNLGWKEAEAKSIVKEAMTIAVQSLKG